MASNTKGMNIEVIGDVELARKFQELGNMADKTDLIEAILLAVAEPIRAEASRNAPRRVGGKGTLSKEIIKKTIEKRRARVVVGVGPSKKAWYGVFPERGTSHSPAKPYLRPSFDNGKETAKGEITSKLWDEIEGVARS